MKSYFLVGFAVFLGVVAGYSQPDQVGQSIAMALTEVLPTIVYQPKSPPRIDKFVMARETDGRISSYNEMWNTGKKEVRSYRVARWFSDNTGYVSTKSCRREDASGLSNR